MTSSENFGILYYKSEEVMTGNCLKSTGEDLEVITL